MVGREGGFGEGEGLKDRIEGLVYCGGDCVACAYGS